MDGCMMDGWMERWTDRQRGEWMDRWKEGVGGWVLGVRWTDQWVSWMNHLIVSLSAFIYTILSRVCALLLSGTLSCLLLTFWLLQS